MPNAPPNSADNTRNPGADALEPIAANALAAIIDAGVQALIAEPWRVGRIIGGAQNLDIDALAARTARRRRATPADLNQAIALAQLSRALKSPLFRSAWANWRIGAAGEQAQASGLAARASNTSETDAARGDNASLIA
jgi:hypothetical protein